jgi:outer membrane protein assembly factor BamB
MGKVYALDAATGTEQWRFQTGGHVHSSPVVVDGTVYVGSWDGNVYALTGGNQQWRDYLPVAVGAGFAGVGGGAIWWARRKAGGGGDETAG